MNENIELKEVREMALSKAEDLLRSALGLYETNYKIYSVKYMIYVAKDIYKLINKNPELYTANFHNDIDVISLFAISECAELVATIIEERLKEDLIDNMHSRLNDILSRIAAIYGLASVRTIFGQD